MASATCSVVATSSVAARVAVRAAKPCVARAPFFTGARLAAARPAAAAATRTPVRTMALFGGGAATAGKDLYNFTVKGIDGRDIKTSQFKNKVLLIINVASACGFTPQYTEMAELYNKYAKQGLEVLAFPCNQFGAQEPGSNGEIKSFAERKGFKGPMFAKTDVNGPNAEPLFQFLKGQQGGLLTSDIKWNFTKFLVDRSGNVVKRYGSTTTPMQIEADIKSLL